jgi:hypothetical protein
MARINPRIAIELILNIIMVIPPSRIKPSTRIVMGMAIIMVIRMSAII